jgi:hypothetical protein
MDFWTFVLRSCNFLQTADFCMSLFATCVSKCSTLTFLTKTVSKQVALRQELHHTQISSVMNGAHLDFFYGLKFIFGMKRVIFIL